MKIYTIDLQTKIPYLSTQ